MAENDITDILPGLHIYSESDVIAAFMNPGKVKLFEMVLKSKYLTFSMLGDQIDTQQSTFDDLKKFVLAMYGKLHMDDVNDIRFASFKQHYVPNKPDDERSEP